MLHTLRENETFADLAYIYNVSEEDLRELNDYDASLPNIKNSAVFVPANEKVFFYNGDLNAICEQTGLNKKDLLILSGTKEENLIKNTAIRLPVSSENKFDLGLVCDVSFNDGNFVNADRYAKYIKSLYIDCYDIIDNNLNLPYDYPAINACNVNGVKPKFILWGLKRYEGDDILKQLKHDLLFKDYTGVLIVTEDISETACADKIAENLKSEDFEVEVCCSHKDLKNVNKALYDRFYLRQDKNLFDYESFEKTVKNFVKLFPEENKGFFYKSGCADIAKNTMNVANPTAKMLSDIFYHRNIDRISFDEDSQLCFCAYTDESVKHNVVYEDIRSFYSKMNFLKQNAINNIIIAESDPRVIVYDRILKYLSDLS